MNRPSWKSEGPAPQRAPVVPMRLAQGLRDERDALHVQLREAQAALAATEPEPSLAALRGDLRRIRARTADEVAQARRRERVERLRDLAEARDALESAVDQSPDAVFASGLRGVLGLMDAGLRRAEAHLIGAAGEAFDPTRHEAVAVVPDPRTTKEQIMQVVRPGIELADGTLVRPARVVVARPVESGR